MGLPVLDAVAVEGPGCPAGRLRLHVDNEANTRARVSKSRQMEAGTNGTYGTEKRYKCSHILQIEAAPCLVMRARTRREGEEGKGRGRRGEEAGEGGRGGRQGRGRGKRRWAEGGE